MVRTDRDRPFRHPSLPVNDKVLVEEGHRLEHLAHEALGLRRGERLRSLLEERGKIVLAVLEDEEEAAQDKHKRCPGRYKNNDRY